jgi:phosphatidylserine decarboxylase
MEPMPVAVQALPYLAALLAAAIVSGWFFGAGWAVPFVAAAGFVLFFFRDPERVSPEGEGLVVSPADGRVTEVERHADGARISIFLSVFNCHINRAPVASTVTSVRYTPGRFRPAWDARVPLENERNHLDLKAADGEYGVTQIAGILARRIVCFKSPGDAVTRGERLGLIQFGSRTDLHLPAGVEPVVRVGDRVRGAVSVLARRESAAQRAAS